MQYFVEPLEFKLKVSDGGVQYQSWLAESVL